MSVNHTPIASLSLSLILLRLQTLLKLSLSLFHYLISPFPAPNDEAAGREERDLGGIYCTVKPGWKRRIPSDLRS